MKKLFDSDDSELNHEEKAKILVTVIPFVLIILILAVTLLVNGMKKNKDDDKNEDLQQSIMEYADSSKQEEKEPIATKAPDPDPGEERTPEPTASPVKEEPKETPEPTPTPYKPAMSNTVDYSKVEFDKDEQLVEFRHYWEEGNQKALDDLANLDRFIAMSWTLRDSKDFYYSGDRNANGQPHGVGIAVYADNQYYYGDWENGERSGNGRWMHYHIHTTANKTDIYTYHQYTGEWKNDLPDGEGSEHYEYQMELLKKNTRYTTNLIGSYSKGLLHGEIYLTNIDYEGDVREWDATAKNGSWVYLSKNRDKAGKGPVIVSRTDPDDYIWMLPKDNKNLGVVCLISSNKN